MEKLIVWLVDEDPDEAHVYRRRLSVLLGDEVSVEVVNPPLPSLQDYRKLLKDNTGAIILDQRLAERGETDTGEGISYTGIELAQYLRSLKTKIPIYILTNYAKDKDAFAGLKWSVEDILDKDILSDPEKYAEEYQVAQARMRRSLNIYRDILDARARRFNELLHKSLTDELTETELDELDELQGARALPVAAGEVGKRRKLDQFLQQQEELLAQLRSKNPPMDQEGDKSEG